MEGLDFEGLVKHAGFHVAKMMTKSASCFKIMESEESPSLYILDPLYCRCS